MSIYNSLQNSSATLINTDKNISNYMEALVQQLRTKVSNNGLLKSENWTKSCYALFADIIGHDLSEKMSDRQRMEIGTSISSKTLQKIFDGQYKLSYPIDPRSLNTLNKLVFFLGFPEWISFTKQFEKETEKTIINTYKNEEITDIVKTAIQTEYQLYSELPKNPEKHLEKIFIKNSQSYLRILEVLKKQESNQCSISNKCNPSTCEILDIKVEKINKEYAQVVTSEYWLLCWWDKTKNRYIKRYKNICDHFYILNKVDNTWKIKTNASIADIIDY